MTAGRPRPVWLVLPNLTPRDWGVFAAGGGRRRPCDRQPADRPPPVPYCGPPCGEPLPACQPAVNPQPVAGGGGGEVSLLERDRALPGSTIAGLKIKSPTRLRLVSISSCCTLGKLSRFRLCCNVTPLPLHEFVLGPVNSLAAR